MSKKCDFIRQIGFAERGRFKVPDQGANAPCGEGDIGRVTVPTPKKKTQQRTKKKLSASPKAQCYCDQKRVNVYIAVKKRTPLRPKYTLAGGREANE